MAYGRVNGKRTISGLEARSGDVLICDCIFHILTCSVMQGGDEVK